MREAIRCTGILGTYVLDEILEQFCQRGGHSHPQTPPIRGSNRQDAQ